MSRLRILLIVIAMGLFMVSTVGAQSDEPPNTLVVNYAETGGNAANQQVDIFFTLTDANGRALSNPDVSEARFTLGGVVYPITRADVSVPSEPLNLSILLDTSGSMSGVATERMKAAAIDAVRNAPPNTQFSIFTFDNNIDLITPVFSDDRDAVVAAIDALPIFTEGGTCLFDATLQALQQYETFVGTGRRGVIVFTDGRDRLNAQTFDPCSVNADANDLIDVATQSSLSVPIYTIGLRGGEDLDEAALRNLANNTGGVFAFGDSDELTETFQTIMAALDSQRVATVEVCQGQGAAAGILEVTSGSVVLAAPVNNLQFDSNCTIATDTPMAVVVTEVVAVTQAVAQDVPTATPSTSPTSTETPIPTATYTSTPIPLSLEIGRFRLDTATNELIFEIVRSGVGEVAQIVVRVIDAERNVAISTNFGRLILAGDTREVRIPLAEIPANTIIVEVDAYSPLGQIITTGVSNPVQPERTATPSPSPTITDVPTSTLTPTPTLTFTPVPTNTLTPTPINIDAAITRAEFNEDERLFVVDLDLANVEGVIAGYNLLFENNNGVLIHDLRPRSGPYDNELRIPEDEIGLLAPGSYAIRLEILLPNGELVEQDVRQAVVPGEVLTDEAGATVVTRTVETGSDDGGVTDLLPIVLGAAIIVLLLLLLLFVVLRTRQKDEVVIPPPPTAVSEDIPSYNLPRDNMTEVGSTPYSAFGAALAYLTVLHSPGGLQQFEQYEYPFTETTVMFRMGRDGGSPGSITHLNFTDRKVSKLHAEIRYIDGHFELADLESRNGTYLNGKRVYGAEVLRHDVRNEIVLGEFTRLSFVYTDMPEPMPVHSGINETLYEGSWRRADDLMTQPDDGYVGGIDDLPPTIEAQLSVEGDPEYVPGVQVWLKRTVLFIGRRPDGLDPATQLRLSSPRVSSQHAQLYWEVGYFYLVDTGSRNGTFIDDEPVIGPMPLQAGRPYQIQLASQEPVILHFSYDIGSTIIGEEEEIVEAYPEAEELLTNEEAEVEDNVQSGSGDVWRTNETPLPSFQVNEPMPLDDPEDIETNFQPNAENSQEEPDLPSMPAVDHGISGGPTQIEDYYNNEDNNERE